MRVTHKFSSVMPNEHIRTTSLVAVTVHSNVLAERIYSITCNVVHAYKIACTLQASHMMPVMMRVQAVVLKAGSRSLCSHPLERTEDLRGEDFRVDDFRVDDF